MNESTQTVAPSSLPIWDASETEKAFVEGRARSIETLSPYYAAKRQRLVRIEHPINGKPMSRALTRWFQTMGRLRNVVPMGYMGRSDRRRALRTQARMLARGTLRLSDVSQKLNEHSEADANGYSQLGRLAEFVKPEVFETPRAGSFTVNSANT